MHIATNFIISTEERLVFGSGTPELRRWFRRAARADALWLDGAAVAAVAHAYRMADRAWRAAVRAAREYRRSYEVSYRVVVSNSVCSCESLAALLFPLLNTKVK